MMKTIKWNVLWLMAVSLVSTTLFTACNDDDDDVPAISSKIVQVVNADGTPYQP